MAKTAICESADHFLTFRLWSKALIGLPIQEVAQAFPEYHKYAQWLIKERFRQPKTSPHLWHLSMVGFFLDYMWTMVALYDHTHPLSNYISTGRIFSPEVRDLAVRWNELFEPGILAVWALHSAPAIINHGIPFLIDLWQKKTRSQEREREKEKEENEREKIRERQEEEDEEEEEIPSPKHLFDNLNFNGFDFVYDPKFGDVIEFIIRHQPEGVKSLRMAGCSRILDPNLSRLLGPSLTTLELTETPFVGVFDDICSRCVHLTRLVLDGGGQDLPKAWIERVMENLRSLKELETNQDIWPDEKHNKETLLSQLEVLRCSDPEGLLGLGYRMPNLKDLNLLVSNLPGSVCNLSNCVALRRLVLRRIFSQREEFEAVDLLCKELAEGCPCLEVLDAEPYCFTPHHLETLASTRRITSLQLLTLQMIVNTDTQETGPEYEAAFLRTLAQHFPSLKHLTIHNRLAERQGEVLLALCEQSVLAGSPLQLESLIVPAADEGANEWVQVLRHFKGSIKRLSYLPTDTSDEHAEDLADVLQGIEELQLEQTILTVEGMKRILPSLRNLKRIHLPARHLCAKDLDCLTVLVPLMSSSVLTVVTHEELPEVPESTMHMPLAARIPEKWPRLLGLKKGKAAIILQINSISNDYAKVKLTGALGPDDDTIDKKDSFTVIASDDYLTRQLRLLQEMHRYNALY